jgi:hypothetical protein
LKELIFHIGTPKTGTSALQVFLAKNRQVLLTKSLDYLPIGEIALGTAGKVSSGNGAFLSRSVLPVNAPARMADDKRLADECYEMVRKSEADRGVISSELFTYADSRAFSTLLAGLKELGVVPRCLYFIRSQPQCLASIYMQQVKRHGCTEQPESYVRRTYKNTAFLKHHSFYLKQCELFDASNVICRTYDGAVATKKGLFHAMLNALSVEPTDLDFSVDDINTSLSVRDLSIMLLLNRFSPRMRFSDAVIENAAQFGSAASGRVHNFLPLDLIDELEQYFAKENADLARDYFHRAQLFPPASLETARERVTVDNLSVTDVIVLFGGLLVRYDKRIASLETRLAKENRQPPNAAVQPQV